MSRELLVGEAVDAELVLLRRSLIEMRTAGASGSGSKSRSHVRRRIARFLGLRSSTVATS